MTRIPCYFLAHENNRCIYYCFQKLSLHQIVNLSLILPLNTFYGIKVFPLEPGFFSFDFHFLYFNILMSCSKVISTLIKNNHQWSVSIAKAIPTLFPSTASSQNPYALVIGCSDSRVPFTQLTNSPPVKFSLY